MDCMDYIIYINKRKLSFKLSKGNVENKNPQDVDLNDKKSVSVSASNEKKEARVLAFALTPALF